MWQGVELQGEEVVSCLPVSSSPCALITWMCAYSNGFCLRRPLANQVPSTLTLSHKLGTDVLGRADVEFVDIVSLCVLRHFILPLLHRKHGSGTWILSFQHGGGMGKMIVSYLLPTFEGSFFS